MCQHLAILLLLITTTTYAQQASKPTAFGTVAGSVTCTDTNLPARLVRVALSPIPEATTAVLRRAPNQPDFNAPAPHVVRLYQTYLDGSFVIPHVTPGRYFVIVQQPGYLSPVAQYNAEEMESPTPEMLEKLEKTLPTVLVVPNQTASADIRLVRAASITGTIRFDDGSPAPGLSLRFQRQDNDGKWVDTATGNRVRTDDLGHFHAAGLPAAEYRILTSLYLDEAVTDQLFGGSSSSTSSTKQSVNIFLGDTFFRKDAKLLKVGDGEDATANITIPNSKLHRISGSLIDARTGSTINAGKISLTTADGQAIASGEVERDDPVFLLEFVPEGEYTVHILDAREVTRQPLPPAPGRYIDVPQFKETVVTRYQGFEAPLIVQGDQSGVTFSVRAQKPGGVGD
jgi:hypothetical protein